MDDAERAADLLAVDDGLAEPGDGRTGRGAGGAEMVAELGQRVGWRPGGFAAGVPAVSRATSV
ncbi:MAG TPA: hypothetical protein VLR26_09750 [Frankiaceae bacterium]|nr:hypothetical protein [Frankiaceae bacterium]